MFRPSLKIVGLHIDGLKPIRKLDWPEDGMGWGETIPDVVLLGGVNGSGKTTLLTTIVNIFRAASSQSPDRQPGYDHTNPRPKVSLELHHQLKESRLPESDLVLQTFDKKIPNVGNFESVYLIESEGQLVPAFRADGARQVMDQVTGPRASTSPGVVFLPSSRPLVVPAEQFKAPGQLTATPEFVHAFEPPAKWNQSLEGLLYALRWQDLNAMAEGRPEAAHAFQAYAETFELFYKGKKKLTWKEGVLLVELADGTTHGLDELSSGEKQVIVIASELLRHWRPGSIILIDEPELHFHPQWQTDLWSLLVRWQKERGGQVIVATQSNHLFRISDPGSHVLLGAEPLA